MTTRPLALLKTFVSCIFSLGFLLDKNKNFSYPEFPSAAHGTDSGARSPAEGKLGAAEFSAPPCQPPQ